MIPAFAGRERHIAALNDADLLRAEDVVAQHVATAADVVKRHVVAMECLMDDPGRPITRGANPDGGRESREGVADQVHRVPVSPDALGRVDAVTGSGSR